MIEQDLLKYCYFYKEEALPPIDQNDGCRLLWLAEKWICEEGNNLVLPPQTNRLYEKDYHQFTCPLGFGRM